MFRFVKLREEHLPQVLEWRTKPRVTRYMFSDMENDLEEQREWFRKTSVPHWVIHQGTEPIGVVNLSGISWGFYIGEDDAVALGGLVPPYLYNHAFKTREKLTAEVMAGNERVMRMHMLHGYSRGDVKKDNVYKNGQYYDVHTFDLSRADWLAQAKRYGHFLAEFEE